MQSGDAFLIGRLGVSEYLNIWLDTIFQFSANNAEYAIIISLSALEIILIVWLAISHSSG